MCDDDDRLEIMPVGPDRWPDLVALFRRPGPRGGRQDTANCWCAVWRTTYRSPEANERGLCELVERGQEPGLLAHLAGRPVGWVSVAPLQQFEGLLRSPRFRPQDTDGRGFAITCFHVDRDVRGRGVGGALATAAVRRAAELGASSIHAYPREPADYKGRAEWFLQTGFVPVRETGGRTVMRLDLTAG